MPPTTAPLRTALIGLSASAATSWASAAHLPGLLSEAGRSKLPIVALLNSSVSAAQAAIKTYNLPSTTKAYGSPEDLANDLDIDFVICNTRVDKHFSTILPSVKMGKDVYVEWPIAANPEEINTLVEAARKSGSRVSVGLQRRWTPVTVKVRELLKEGKGGRTLGRLLSSDVRAFGATNDREILPESLKYFSERAVGGNSIVIGNGHAFDLVLSALGDLDPSTVSTKLQLQRPDIRIRNTSTNEIVETTRSNVPDLLSLHGTLIPSQATLSFNFRRGQPFPNTPSLVWTINCEFGEIRIVSQSNTSLETEAGAGDQSVKIHVHWFEDDKVENVEWKWDEEQEALPLPARSIMRTLLAFADGKAEEDGWVGLEDAAKRAEMIEGFMREWEQSRK